MATQQATNPNPTTKPAKNPKRVAAAKVVAEKMRMALEVQKKALAEAEIIIANHNAKKKAHSNHPSVDADDPGLKGLQGDRFSNSRGLNTTQWVTMGAWLSS